MIFEINVPFGPISGVVNTEDDNEWLMSGPRVSIVIRCFNEREHIKKLLHGVFEQRIEDFEVILVDSGSTDGTLEIAKQFSIDEIVFISPEEFSFGRALNYGCEAANGQYCVFASAHVYPKRKDWLEKLLAKFGDDVALVYGKQRGDDTTKYPEKRVFRRWFPGEDVEYQASPFCNNANAAIRREVWEKFPYDERLTGLEDLDWAKRVQDAGWNISYASDAEVIHVHDESPMEVYDRYRREAIAHKQIFPDQEFSFWDFIKLFSSNTAADYLAAVREGELPGSIIEIPRFRLMQFWGTYRGFSREKPVTDRLWRRFYYPDENGYPSEESDERDPKSEQTSLRIDYSGLGDECDHDPADNYSKR